MKFLTFQSAAGAPRPGVLTDDDRVVDVKALAESASVSVPDDVLGLIRDPAAVATVRRLLNDGTAPTLRLADLTLLAPLRPGKIVGVGLNYVRHVDESSRTLDTDKDRPTRPVLFSKPSTAVVAPGAAIQHNAELTTQLDWECELAVVIGRAARRVSAVDAMQYVFGYTIVNDVSARDQRRGQQWFFSKGQDSYAPLGPWVVTADEIDNPQDLDFRLTVNGVEKQNSNTKNMLFSIADLIEDISSGITLEPGDVIATGSAEGVGAAQNPPQFLQPGDVVELTIDKIGVLTNPVIAV